MSRIDVILPYFEGEAFIEGALRSVEEAASGHEIRVVVIDDGSSARSHAILRRVLDRSTVASELIVHEANRGIGAARQRGLDAVETEVVGFVDQDDRWRPNLVSSLLDLLEGAEHAAGLMQMELLEGCQRPTWCRPAWLEGPLPGTVVGAGLFRTEALRRLGGFNPALRAGGDDVDLLARFRRAQVETASIDEVVLTRLVHEDNASGRTATDGDLLAGVRAHLGAR